MQEMNFTGGNFMGKTATDDMFLIRCEKIVNETWSKAAIHYDDIKRIVEIGEINDKKDKIILMIAANATLQKMTLDKAMDKQYFDFAEEMSPCGNNPKHKCPCNRKICLIDK